jgi:hypothetical protein
MKGALWQKDPFFKNCMTGFIAVMAELPRKLSWN